MPRANYPHDLFQGVLPAAGAGPVEDLEPSSKQLVSVMTVVKGLRRGGYRIFKSHPGALDVWRTEGSKFLLRAWQIASEERRSAFKRSLEAFDAVLQAGTGADPAVLPSFETMRIFLAWSPTPHHPSGLALAHLAVPLRPASDSATPEQRQLRSVPVELPFDPTKKDVARKELSLATTSRPLLGLRAAARYGLDKDEWERRAHGLHR